MTKALERDVEEARQLMGAAHSTIARLRSAAIRLREQLANERMTAREAHDSGVEAALHVVRGSAAPDDVKAALVGSIEALKAKRTEP